MQELDEYNIVMISKNPLLIDKAAGWFSSKWKIPKQAYLESMEESFKNTEAAIPEWYIAIKEDKSIIGGCGVIVNDFHDRPDLTPNVCAVYIEDEYRGRGIAGKLLNMVCEDMLLRGIQTLYLLTDHLGFYERYGWDFLCMVQGDGDKELSRMYMRRLQKINE